MEKHLSQATLRTVDDYIAIRVNNGEMIIPSAEELFSYAFQGIRTIRGHEIVEIVPSTQEFSRFPAELKIRLDATPSSSELHISCRIVARTSRESCIVNDALRRTADHMLISGTWYPFVFGVLDNLRNILQHARVADLSSLTLANYLALSKADCREWVEDHTEHRLDADQMLAHFIEAPPSELRAQLYPYQIDGYNWLRTVCGEDIGCILADEMGLGKTLQVIALLVHRHKFAQKPSLIIVPATLVENWTRELRKFAPSLDFYVHKGSSRTGFPIQIQESELVVMSYDTLVQDIAMLKMIQWDLLIADEAQAVKNPDTKRTSAVKSVTRRATIAVTGTPLENRNRDLWSIADLVVPGLLGNLREFEARYADSVEDAARLEPIVTPILLRRRVADVAKDLPERIDIPQPIEMHQDLAKCYEELRSATETEYGKAATLVSLGKLRQFCVHPFQLTGEWGNPATDNGKYERFLEILEEIFARKEKVLVFIQYLHASDLFAKDLHARFGVYVDSIDGRVPISERQLKVDRFSAHPGSAVFMLNPRTAGIGLNLTAANHVIHYGPDWNPAIEDQASARSHRRGQTHPVTIHRMFFVDSVEDIIIQRLEHKRQLAEMAIVGTKGDGESREEIMRALRASPIKRRNAEDGS